MPNSAAVSESLKSAITQRFPQDWQPPSDLLAVIDSLLAFHPASSIENVIRGYKYADYFHRTQNRRSGESYISHPVAVAGILADLGMTEPTIIAALLHDTVEDTEYSLEQLEVDFGSEIAGLVDGVTKLDKVKFGNTSAAETVRKMVVAMARDIRVLVIKLADRLHNMRTLGALPADKQEQKARLQQRYRHLRSDHRRQQV